MTWSDPVRLPVTAPHGPSVCKDGTLVYLGNVFHEDSDARPPITCYTSVDGGYTWNFAGEVPDTTGPRGETVNAYNMFEPHVVELPGGRLLGAIRTHNEVLRYSLRIPMIRERLGQSL